MPKVSSVCSQPSTESVSLEDELQRIEDQLDSIQVETVRANIDLDSTCPYKCGGNLNANKWRVGPVERDEGVTQGKETKIAMMQASHSEKGRKDTLPESLLLLSTETSRDANRALTNYFAWLGLTDENGQIDFNFLDHLLLKADVNVQDNLGQTIMHEIAREWTVDLANYVKLKGVNVDQEDHFGRTPLFVATSANHVEMIGWLLDNGADLNHKSVKGEGQCSIHFAAKSDSVEAFMELVKQGADPLAEDDRLRTPFYLAAEKGNQDMCDYMLEMELPVASYTMSGFSTIDHIVDKLPTSFAERALNQFQVVENSYCFCYISCLGKRRWQLLHKQTMGCYYKPQTVLEIIINQRNLRLIKHPVILQLIKIKAKFSARYVYINVFWYFVFTFLWTITVCLPLPHGARDYEHAQNPGVSYSILVFSIMGQLLTFAFMGKLVLQYKCAARRTESIQHLQHAELELDRPFCHPAWAFEKQTLDEQIISLRKNGARNFFLEGWNIIELFCLLMATLQMIFTVHWYVNPGDETVYNTRAYFSAVFIVVVWLRLNRALSFLQWLGPFIAMLGECVIATGRFAFLFFEFFIPFAVTFWVLFGNKRKGVDESEYETFNGLLYQMFLLTFVGDYELEPLMIVDTVFAQICVSLYLILVSIVSLNLYIALLSEAVARVNNAASATAYLKEANEYNTYEGMVPNLQKRFETYTNVHCSPLVIPKSKYKYQPFIKLSTLRNTKMLSNSTMEMSRILQEAMDSFKALKHFSEKVKNFTRSHPKAKEKGIQILFALRSLSRPDNHTPVPVSKDRLPK